MGPPLPLLAVLALAASRCRADSQCSDGGAEPEVHGAESDDDGALAQLRTARVRPNLKDISTTNPYLMSFPPPAPSPGAGGFECTGSQCSQWTGSGDTPAPSTTDGDDGGDAKHFSLTSAPPPAPPPAPSPGAGGSMCPIFDYFDSAAEMKKAGKCGADGCTCSGGGVSTNFGCRSCIVR